VGNGASERFQRRLVRRPSVPGHEAGDPAHQVPLSTVRDSFGNSTTIGVAPIRSS
jgi:hypothetical protein